MLGCLFNRAWQTYAHSMLCICDAKNTTLLLYGRTKEAGVYIGCYDVIPGRDQESMIMRCRMCFKLSLALCWHWDKIPGPGQGWRCWEYCAVVLWMYTQLFCSLRMRCLHYKYFEWMTGGCADGSLLMYAQTNEHHLHSYVLLFFCLNKKNYH